MFHYFAFSWAFIVDATQVKNAVYDNSVEFFVIGCVVFQRIAFNGVETYEDVSVKGVALGVVECDDIGVVVVVEVLSVYFKNFWIVAKDVCHFSYFLVIG